MELVYISVIGIHGMSHTDITNIYQDHLNAVREGFVSMRLIINTILWN